MATTTLAGDVYVQGSLSARDGVRLGGNTIGSTQFNASDPLAQDKQRHRVHRLLAQPHGTAAAAERRAVYVAHRGGTVLGVAAGVVAAAAGDSTASVDVRKNGTTVLSAPIGIDSTNAAHASETGTLSASTYSAGDVFEVVVTVAAGTGTPPQGLFVSLVLDEDAA